MSVRVHYTLYTNNNWTSFLSPSWHHSARFLRIPFHFHHSSSQSARGFYCQLRPYSMVVKRMDTTWNNGKEESEIDVVASARCCWLRVRCIAVPFYRISHIPYSGTRRKKWGTRKSEWVSSPEDNNSADSHKNNGQQQQPRIKKKIILVLVGGAW